MKIYKIEINCLRGIKHLVMDFRGKNAVIYGDNGTGKSGVIDAVDFLLQGDISRISGEGMKDVTLSAHGKHVTENVKDAWVSAEIKIPQFKEKFTITRRLTKPKELECEAKYKDALLNISSIAKMKAHFLSRREILKYINSTDGDRAKSIESLLSLDSLPKNRVMLNKLQNEHENCLSRGRVLLAKITSDISQKLMVAGTEDWLEAINELRTKFGAIPIESYETEKLLNGISFSSQERVIAQKTALLNSVGNIINLISGEGGLFSLLRTLISKLRQIAEFKDIQKYLNCLELYKAGLSTAEEDVCPLCNQAISTTQLVATLRQKINDLSSFEEIKKEKIALLNAVQDKVLTAISSYDQQKQADSSIEQIDPEIEKIKAFKIALNEDLDIEVINQFVSTLKVSVLEEYKTALGKEIANLSLNNLQMSYKTLSDVDSLLKEYYRQMKAVNDETKNCARITALSGCYSTAQEEWLNELYKSIEYDFSTYYRKMHSADESTFKGELKKSGASLSMRVDFFDGKQYPPNAVHSEGHQDSMGICLFFALSKKITNENLDLILLDDVVMSIDIDHRISFCNLLKEVFPNKQFIITTHDYIWRTELEQQHIVESQNVFYFKAWDISKGPLLAKTNDIWERISDDLSTGNKNEAAYLLRYYLEEFLADICSRYRLPVPYSSTARWTLEEKFNPVHSFFKSSLDAAKQSLISFHRDTSQIDSVIEKYNNCFKALNADKWILNPSTHYTDWAKSISLAELQALAVATQNYCECLKCENCGTSLIFREVQNGKPKCFGCDCGVHNYSCIKNKN